MSESLRRTWRQLTADKQRLSLMLALTVVMMLLWGRLLLKQIPRTANATPAANAAVATTPATAARPVATRKSRSRAVIEVDLASHLERDLFAFSPQGYPQVEIAIDPVQSAAKSGPEAADENTEEVVSRTLAGLHLQTTILGEKPRAVINGQVLQPGQNIEGMTLRRVLAREVILECQGRQVKLGM